MVGALKAVSPIPVGIHAHNDFGAALANSLAAVEAGIDIVDVSVTGLGKRGGNAALEQMALALHQIVGDTGGVRLEALYALTRQVTEILGAALPHPNHWSAHMHLTSKLTTLSEEPVLTPW